MEEIFRLREEIDKIDNEIIRLLNKRINIVRKIGSIKAENKRSIRDRSREEVIIRRAGKYKNVFKEIMKLSVELQKETCFNKNKFVRRRIGIIGYGKMGRLFYQIFSKHHDIAIYDIRRITQKLEADIYSRLIDLIRDVDIILVATPLKDTPKILEDIRKMTAKENISNKIFFDIVTLKDRVIPILKRYPSNVKVCSIHPLFGTNIKSIEDETVVIIPIENRDNECREVIELLRPYGFNIIKSTQKTHDTIIGYTIGIPYFIAMTFWRTVLNRDAVEISKYAGSSYKYFMNYVTNILMNDDKGFVKELLKDQYVSNAVKDFVKNVVNSEKNIEKIVAFLYSLKQ